MKVKPVNLYFAILYIIYEKKMSVNEIYKKTSLDHKDIFKKAGLSYKKNFTDTLKELEKDKIIKREKDPKKHKQREYLSLTDLGFELLEIKKGLDDYISSYKKLYEIENNLKGINNIGDQTQIKNILRHRGWKDEEVFWFEEAYECIKVITWYGDFDLFEGFIYRYILILSKFELGEISQSIINSLLINVMNFKIENISSKDLSEKVENYKIILDQHLGNISEFNHAFPNLFQNEVKNHIFSRLYFLRPPKNLIAKKLEDKQSIIEEYKKNATEEIKKDNLLNPAIYSKSLIDAYKEYLNIERI